MADAAQTVETLNPEEDGHRHDACPGSCSILRKPIAAAPGRKFASAVRPTAESLPLGPMHNYLICGLSVSSELVLPGAIRQSGPTAVADVSVRRATVPAALGGTRTRSELGYGRWNRANANFRGWLGCWYCGWMRDRGRTRTRRHRTRRLCLCPGHCLWDPPGHQRGMLVCMAPRWRGTAKQSPYAANPALEKPPLPPLYAAMARPS